MNYTTFFVPMCTVKNDKVILWNAVYSDWPAEENPYKPKTEHKFSLDAQKRFLQCFDNLANLFESAPKRQKNFFDYKIEGKFYRRKPTFLTLTVPIPGNHSDMKIKEECFIPFKEALIANHGVKNYIWKAEAQLRGAIHFHMILDIYQDHKKIRKMWFRKLRECGLIKATQTLEESSRISWVQETNDLSVLKLELASYFATTEDENGEIVYKHDREKRVRHIEGNSWGRSDYLNYRALTLKDIDKELEISIASTSIDYFLVSRESNVRDIDGNKEKIPCAECFLYKKVYGHGNHKQVVSSPMENNMKEVLDLYHFNQASKIYGGRTLTRSEELMLYRNHSIKIIPCQEEDYKISQSLF